jgi:hypothetical protein
MVPILRLSLRVHGTGTTFVIYLEIDTRSVISPIIYVDELIEKQIVCEIILTSNVPSFFDNPKLIVQ